MSTAMFLIQTQTANNSAQLVFSQDISTYKKIVFVVSNLTTSSLGDIPFFLTSSDGGSNFYTTSYLSGIDANPYDTTKRANLNTTTSILIGDQIDTPGAVNAYIFCTNAATAQNFTCNGLINYLSEGKFIAGQMFAQGQPNINAFKFTLRDGVMVSGTISQYGITS